MFIQFSAKQFNEICFCLVERPFDKNHSKLFGLQVSVSIGLISGIVGLGLASLVEFGGLARVGLVVGRVR